MSWPGDSSYDKNRHRSPRLQVCTAKAAARLVLPVPAVPDTRIVLPLVYPPPWKSLSSEAMPVDTLSAVPGWSRPAEVMGMTESPPLSMTKGYSFAPWLEPRYLMMRIRLVAICSLTRLSTKMMQSEIYSSRPWWVNVPCCTSPVISAVTCLSLSQRKSLLISKRNMPVSVTPANNDSMESSTTRFALMESIACSSRTKIPSRLNSPAPCMSRRSSKTWSSTIFFLATSSSKFNLREATSLYNSSSVSSNDMKTPGSL